MLSLVPHRRSFLTRMGVWSLVVYLCHGFVVRYLEYRGYEDWMPGPSWWSVIITVAVGVALALVIAWEPVARTLELRRRPDQQHRQTLVAAVPAVTLAPSAPRKRCLAHR